MLSACCFKNKKDSLTKEKVLNVLVLKINKNSKYITI